VHGARQATETAGATLMYLPAYSPDFNPIEMAFSKLKAFLRAKAAPRPTTLFAALDVLEGKVIGRCMQRHWHQEFAS
jgi:transposase